MSERRLSNPSTWFRYDSPLRSEFTQSVFASVKLIRMDRCTTFSYPILWEMKGEQNENH